MPNIGRPSSTRRKLLYHVVQSILLYGAPVWEKALRIGRHRDKIIRTQRRALIKIAMAYRTVSAQAITTITGVSPIDLLVAERTRLHKSREGELGTRKKRERERTLDLWQKRWEAETTKAQWTKVLIPDTRVWYKCEHRKLNYQLTQFLSGHESFKKITYRIRKEADDKCLYCDEVDTQEHTVLECHRWENIRNMVGWWTGAGPVFDANQLVQSMNRDERKWREASQVITEIMKQKEDEERRRQNIA